MNASITVIEVDSASANGELARYSDISHVTGLMVEENVECTAMCVRQGSKSSMDLLQAKRLNVRWSSVFGLVGSGMSISGSGRAVCGYENNLTNADHVGSPGNTSAVRRRVFNFSPRF